LESFERYCPYGRPKDVAESLALYLAANRSKFNLIPSRSTMDRASTLLLR